ncbi:hypothetical protein V500_04874, partial [Pseudogymnoascus sp. VKM F-4518 (FW-2643)]
MKDPREQKTPSSPSPTSTAHEATTNPSLPKDYKKIVKSLIHRRDISLDVKIDLWKRFAEYEACVDEENRHDDEEEPVFTATSVGEIGPDVEMPIPWMESESSDNGEGSDSGYGENGSNSVDGVEQAEGGGIMDAVAPRGGEENINDVGRTDEEGIAATGNNRDQGKDNDENIRGNNNRNGSPGATLPISGQENTTITSTTNQEPHAADNTTTNPSPTQQL